MGKNTNSEAGKYDILQNGKGEILIIIKYHAGGPENPRLVYDGGEEALLYRSRESSLMLTNINTMARKPLKGVDEVLMVEVEEDEVAREYKVPMRVVKSLPALMQ